MSDRRARMAETARIVGICVAAGVCLGLAVAEAQLGEPMNELVLQPVAPPLTRISALGDAPLLPEPPPPPGPPPGAPPPAAPPPGPGASPLGHALRVQVEADAIALAEILGPDQVDAAVDRREALSAMVGETRTWDDLVATLEARAAEAPE